MNVKQLTDVVAHQAEEIFALREELEALRVGMRAWATVAQAHIQALEGKVAPEKNTEWKSGLRPSHPVRRPQAPAAAAEELPPEPMLDDPTCNPSPFTDDDCPF